MITITEAALIQIKKILEKEDPALRLRIFVQSGGCSGFSYGFTVDEPQSEDIQIEQDGVGILIDSTSAQHLEGVTINYKKDLMSSQFVIENPNAKSQCGCGKSFSA